ncbi:MAG: SAF domain-containing protein [Actinomycetes bacterium]
MKIRNLDILKNSRLAMGLALFIIAISAGSLIAKEANRTVYVWASNGELAPGNTIASTDLKAVSVLLPESAKNYISANAQLVGAIVMHRIGTGDLIPVDAISTESQKLGQRAVPLTVEITDLPADLQRGEVIDIYAIPNSSQKSISEPELITSGITVAEASSKNNSGKALVVVNLPEDLVMRTLAFISESRLIIVCSNF